jgi:hypothetical protein
MKSSGACYYDGKGGRALMPVQQSDAGFGDKSPRFRLMIGSSGHSASHGRGLFDVRAKASLPQPSAQLIG